MESLLSALRVRMTLPWELPCRSVLLMVAGGVIVAAGACVMHYVGMMAMIFPDNLPIAMSYNVLI